MLGLSFVDNEHIKSIHLVDPSVDVINVLKKKLVDSYITSKDLIKVHRTRGQDVILGPESKLIFIAGMGGKEIQEIILNLLPQLTSFDRLVISPHRNVLELRAYLKTSELGLMDEICLKEDGQFYQILCLNRSSDYAKVPLYGAKIWEGEIGEEYREHQIQTFSYHQDGLSKAFVSYLRQLSN